MPYSNLLKRRQQLMGRAILFINPRYKSKTLGCKVTAVCSGKNAELVRRKGAGTVVDYNNNNQ